MSFTAIPPTPFLVMYNINVLHLCFLDISYLTVVAAEEWGQIIKEFFDLKEQLVQSLEIDHFA